jgi:hypothetical protein
MPLSTLKSAFVIFQAVLGALAAEPKLTLSKGAPWGKLNKRQIFLEAPDRLVAAFPVPSSTTVWVLPQADIPAFRKVLASSLIPEAQWAKMFTAGNNLVMQGSTGFYPPESLVDALRPAERSEIYKLLAKSAENEFFAAPLVITTENMDDWFYRCQLPKPMQEVVRKRSWKDGKLVKFSDVSHLIGLAAENTEIQSVMKHMTRTESLLLELELSYDEDIEKLQRYWKPEKDHTDAGSLLTSLVPKKPGMKATVGISHLLPPPVRQLLYAYPELSRGTIGRFPDCHWTSLNFFEKTIKDYYIDTTIAGRELSTNYTVVKDELTFGDILLFKNGADGVHSCVYIADDVVFSKNGSNVAHPWVLCEIKDLVDVYHDIPDLSIDVLRKNPQLVK